MKLDSVDLKMCQVALRYYMHGHMLIKRPIPRAAIRLADHLEHAMSASGPEGVAAQEEWISTAEASRRTGFSERHIRRLAPQIGRRIGRVWAIRADALPQEP